MSCGTHSLDHCILFKFIFYTSGYIPPHSCAFHTFYLHLFFFICILPGGLFFLSLMMPLISESSELNFNFHFSSQRPHLNYILLSNIYSFEFLYNIRLTCTNLPPKTTKLQATLLFLNRSES